MYKKQTKSQRNVVNLSGLHKALLIFYGSHTWSTLLTEIDFIRHWSLVIRKRKIIIETTITWAVCDILSLSCVSDKQWTHMCPMIDSSKYAGYHDACHVSAYDVFRLQFVVNEQFRSMHSMSRSIVSECSEVHH